MRIEAIYRYPVKGLSAESLDRVAVNAGMSLPYDRAWAIENGPGRFNEAEPKHLPKINFLMLMRNEKLASLASTFDEATQKLTLARAGRPVIGGVLSVKAGRSLIEQFLAAYMKDDLRGPPRIVSAQGHSFSDTAKKCLHIVNLATIRELERGVGQPVDPLRFRPNLVIDGAAPWAEFSWIGKTLCADGAALAVSGRTDRCAATNVNPASGARDMDIPAQLARRWGHTDFGVYAAVAHPGTLTRGMELTISTS